MLFSQLQSENPRKFYLIVLTWVTWQPLEQSLWPKVQDFYQKKGRVGVGGKHWPQEESSFWHPIKGYQGLPWWRSGWESACQCRGRGFEPWSGKIPHATEQLGPWATTTEACAPNKRGRDSERPAHRDEEWPPLATTGESPRTNRRPNTAKNK